MLDLDIETLQRKSKDNIFWQDEYKNVIETLQKPTEKEIEEIDRL